MKIRILGLHNFDEKELTFQAIEWLEFNEKENHFDR